MKDLDDLNVGFEGYGTNNSPTNKSLQDPVDIKARLNFSDLNVFESREDRAVNPKWHKRRQRRLAPHNKMPNGNRFDSNRWN